MDDQFGKYLRLFGSIFFSIIGFIVAVILLLLGLRLIFGLMGYLPWFTYVYMIFILVIPSALFITGYLIYFKRTTTHPVKAARWISYIVFSTALVAWVVFLISDIITFYKYTYTSIGLYRSYNIIFLALNVACFFIIGVLQALTTNKEVDWMERSKI